MSDMTCVDCGLELIQGYMIHESCFEGMLNKNSQQAEQLTGLEKIIDVRDMQVKELQADNQRLKDEISGCILRMDEGDFPDKGYGVTELERKLDECCRNNDSEIDRLKELVDAQQELLACYRLCKRPSEKLMVKLQALKGEQNE